MNWCIVIGCYKLLPFIHLNILRCRRLFGGDVPILLVDDRSDYSHAIAGLAMQEDCAYVCGARRKSHFSGDMQVFISGLEFLKETESDALLKLSQRFIPVLPEFRTVAEKALQDPIQVCCPGRIQPHQIARPQAKFYAKFGILTDVFAIRRDAITPEELLTAYRERCQKPKHKSDSFAETTWGYLLATRFDGKHVLLPEWTNHAPLKAKLYLRKSQSTALDYEQIAKIERMSGDWDLREWGMIEKQQYRARPTQV